MYPSKNIFIYPVQDTLDDYLYLIVLSEKMLQRLIGKTTGASFENCLVLLQLLKIERNRVEKFSQSTVQY